MGQRRKVAVVVWKDEGERGPVWVSENPNYPFKPLVNYKDASPDPNGHVSALWYTRAQARKIAERLGVPLEVM